MASVNVPDGKPLAARAGGPRDDATAALAAWMAAPPARLTVLAPGPGVLADPGPAAPRGRVDIPARPGSAR